MQIYQHARSQYPVDFVFPRYIHSHQSFQRSRLVRAEMIHMHLGIRFAPPHDFVHQPLESLFFLLAIQRPALLITQFVARIVERQPEQILQSPLANERIAFQINKHIVRRRLRQSAKAQSLRNRQKHLMHQALL